MLHFLKYLPQPHSLQQKYALSILLPTLIVLVVIGLVSSLLVRKALLNQWEETTIARMQRTAYGIDLQLARPKRVLTLFQDQTDEAMNRQVASFLLQRLKEVPSVESVTLEWHEQANSESANRKRSPGAAEGMRYSRMRTLEVSPPEYDQNLQGETVSLISEFHDEKGQVVGRILVEISFSSLIENITASPWWQNNKAFLLDAGGRVLAGPEQGVEANAVAPSYRFGEKSEVERRTLEEIGDRAYGAILGEGVTPAEVCGFYRLREAPWTLVILAPGRAALEPVLKFRGYFLASSALGIVLVLLFIRFATNKTAAEIRRVTGAARELASGNYAHALEERGRDEVAGLIRNFNIMTRQLEERMELQQAMAVAREVQQKLLPKSSYQVPGLEICGKSVYCEETGGDYYDILTPSSCPDHVKVVVGDVVGHGIGAALLMASVRSLVRCRTAIAGDGAAVVYDVNRQLCVDTELSGDFISLFYLELEAAANMIRWVRCGHDPALVYEPAGDVFTELKGEGLMLGVDAGWDYRENSLAFKGKGVIVLTSDGVLESENEKGEPFGRERLKNSIRQHHQLSAGEMINSLNSDIHTFCGKADQEDDITLVVVKIDWEKP